MTMINEQRIPKEVRDAYAPFLTQMIDLHGDNLISVFIYGSATGTNFIPKSSDINSVIVVKEISRDTLQKSLKPIAAVKRRRIEAPLILTRDHIQSSLDVFPIEFSDMKKNYVVVYGDDPLSEICIQGEHIRLFCEQQIKGKLIRIRQAYLEVGLRRRGIEMLMRESLNALMPVLRSLLRLKGAAVPADKGLLLTEIGTVFGMNVDVMSAIWNETKNNERVGGRSAREAFGDYIRRLEQLAEAVDQL